MSKKRCKVQAGAARATARKAGVPLQPAAPKRMLPSLGRSSWPIQSRPSNAWRAFVAFIMRVSGNAGWVVSVFANIGVDAFAAADYTLVRRLGRYIDDCWGGHPWLIEVNHRKRVVYLSIPMLMGQRMKYVLLIPSLQGRGGLRALDKACAEILERYRLPLRPRCSVTYQT